jgi:hypothetical protein
MNAASSVGIASLARDRDRRVEHFIVLFAVVFQSGVLTLVHCSADFTRVLLSSVLEANMAVERTTLVVTSEHQGTSGGVVLRAGEMARVPRLVALVTGDRGLHELELL